jgi:hypothetical protein
MIEPKEHKTLELRMYFFTSFYLSQAQHGIQAGHCVEEYGDLYHDDPLYKEYRKQKTWIILNGGTTNNRFELITGDPVGELNQIVEDFQHNAIQYACFQEHGLNDALTAVCFIADERVWNYKDYPDFLNWILNIKMYQEARDGMSGQSILMLRMKTIDELIIMFPEYHKEWIEFLGGSKNAFLRELIKNKKLA